MLEKIADNIILIHAKSGKFRKLILIIGVIMKKIRILLIIATLGILSACVSDVGKYRYEIKCEKQELYKEISKILIKNDYNIIQGDSDIGYIVAETDKIVPYIGPDRKHKWEILIEDGKITGTAQYYYYTLSHWYYHTDENTEVKIKEYWNIRNALGKLCGGSINFHKIGKFCN